MESRLDLQRFANVSNPYIDELEEDLEVSSFIEKALVDLSYYAPNNIDFYGSITEIPQENIEYLSSGLIVSNCSYMFYLCRKLTSIPWNDFNIDTSQCTNMSYMFYDCRYITSLNLTGMDTSKVTDMGYMFYCCESLHEIICPDGFDLSSCTSVDSMFLGIDAYSYTGEPLHFKNVPRDLGFGSIDITEGICYVIDSYKD